MLFTSSNILIQKDIIDKFVNLLNMWYRHSQNKKKTNLYPFLPEKGSFKPWFSNVVTDPKLYGSRFNNWNATDSIYTFETGSQIEFFSADNSAKLRGGRRDRAFMNECNNTTLEAFDEIEVRTKEFEIS